jgi:response regulator of citrate/malate metabolism
VAALAPDVVLLDISAPGLAGLDALEASRVVAPDVRVNRVSSTRDVEEAKRVLAYGAFDYVVKPVDFESLRQSVQITLRMKRFPGGPTAATITGWVGRHGLLGPSPIPHQRERHGHQG